jgi:putative ABC transport system substrate-binding protein
MKGPRLLVIATLSLTLLAAPPTTLAQETGKAVRIGFLSPGGAEQDNFIWSPLLDVLRERGWAEGRNLSFERRYAEGDYDRLPDLAVDLVRLKPDLLVARGGPAALAAKRATATIPIAIWGATDPVGIGLVQSLARPGGNVTGLSDDQGPELVGKRLQLLREVAPRVSKVAVLTRVPPSAASYMNAYEVGAQALGLQLRYWRLQGPDDIDKAFTAIVGERFGALDVAYVVPTWTHRRKIADLALRHRLPAVYWHRTYAVDGGLISYGEDEREVPRRLALYVDKILRGAKPADLPIEQPTKLELVINLKTAKTMGLTIPQSLIGRADEVIR